MNVTKPLVVSFSLLAFASASAYADDAKNESKGSQSSSAPMSSPSTQSGQSGSASSGASGAQGNQGNQGKQSAQNRTEWRVDQLIGTKVRDAQGKELGEIEDVVIDLQKSRVHAAVIQFGGFMGIGDKQYAFPMSELKPGKDNALVVNVDKRKLENAEGFAKGQLPGMDNEYWARVGGKQASAGGSQQQTQQKSQQSQQQSQQSQQSQQQSQQPQGPKMNLVRGSEMQGKEVQDKSGQAVGEVRDVVVGINDGQLKNIVIDVKDAGQATVQARSLSSGTGDKLVLDMSAEQVRKQAKPADRRTQSDAQGSSAGATIRSTPAGGATGGPATGAESPKQPVR